MSDYYINFTYYYIIYYLTFFRASCKIIIGVKLGVLNKNYFDKIRSSKLFFKSDLLLYLAIAVTVTALFLAFVILPSSKPASGFEICRGNDTLFIYSAGEITVEEEFSTLISSQNVDGGLKVTVYTDQSKTHYNVLFFDIEKNTVKVTESNCSFSKDCTYIPAIKNAGTIYCAPHDLKIQPINAEFTPPVAGGGL